MDEIYKPELNSYIWIHKYDAYNKLHIRGFIERNHNHKINRIGPDSLNNFHIRRCKDDMNRCRSM